MGRDTLILITSDESAGITVGYDDLTRQLSQNWGLLIVLTPEQKRGPRDGTFLQSDLALSTLDYLGLEGRGWHMTGRSFFRDYLEPRPLLFANTYTKHIYALQRETLLTRCSDRLTDCSRYRVDRGLLFGPGRVRLAGSSPGALSTLPVRPPPTGGARRSRYDLIATPAVKLRAGQKVQTIFAGQHLYLNPGAQITVELELTLEGEGGLVQLHHDLRSWAEDGTIHTHYKAPTTRLKVGETLHLHYRYRSATALAPMSCRLFAERLAEGRLELQISRATLEILEEAPGAAARPPGITLLHRAITRAKP